MQNDYQCYRRAIASRLVERAKDETVTKSTSLQLSVRTMIVKVLNCIPRFHIVRESVDSLCRDGADAQYMQYLTKAV